MKWHLAPKRPRWTCHTSYTCLETWGGKVLIIPEYNYLLQKKNRLNAIKTHTDDKNLIVGIVDHFSYHRGEIEGETQWGKRGAQRRTSGRQKTTESEHTTTGKHTLGLTTLELYNGKTAKHNFSPLVKALSHCTPLWNDPLCHYILTFPHHFLFPYEMRT